MVSKNFRDPTPDEARHFRLSVPSSFAPQRVSRMRPSEGEIVLHADAHRPESDGPGCTCGFSVWSGEHVAIMAYREACDALGLTL